MTVARVSWSAPGCSKELVARAPGSRRWVQAWVAGRGLGPVARGPGSPGWRGADAGSSAVAERVLSVMSSAASGSTSVVRASARVPARSRGRRSGAGWVAGRGPAGSAAGRGRPGPGLAHDLSPRTGAAALRRQARAMSGPTSERAIVWPPSARTMREPFGLRQGRKCRRWALSATSGVRDGPDDRGRWCHAAKRERCCGGDGHVDAAEFGPSLGSAGSSWGTSAPEHMTERTGEGVGRISRRSPVNERWAA